MLYFLCSLSPNAVLRLRFNHFATECSWDHMYVYDGDSIYAPLIAVFRSANSDSLIFVLQLTCYYMLLHVITHFVTVGWWSQRAEATRRSRRW